MTAQPLDAIARLRRASRDADRWHYRPLRESANATNKPATTNIPVSPYSPATASGTIVLAIIVSSAPAAIALTVAIDPFDADPRSAAPASDAAPDTSAMKIHSPKTYLLLRPAFFIPTALLSPSGRLD